MGGKFNLRIEFVSDHGRKTQHIPTFFHYVFKIDKTYVAYVSIHNYETYKTLKKMSTYWLEKVLKLIIVLARIRSVLVGKTF